MTVRSTIDAVAPFNSPTETPTVGGAGDSPRGVRIDVDALSRRVRGRNRA